MPRASLIIATHNRRSLLAETLRSLEAQSVEPREFEVVVAVDGSTDGTVAMLEEWPRTLNLRWLEMERIGPAGARNRAAALGGAPVLVFLDDDQRAAAEFLERHLAAHESGGRVLVQGYYPVAPEHLRGGVSRLYDRTYRSAMAAAAAGRPFTIWGGNFSIGRDAWLRLGGFDDASFSTYGCEDADLGLRAQAIGIEIVLEPRALTYHLHRCGYRSFSRQVREEAAAGVRLREKHAAAVVSPGGRAGLTRALVSGWRRAPVLMAAAGAAGMAGLWLADRLPWPAPQVALARSVRKIYLADGVASAAAGAGDAAG